MSKIKLLLLLIFTLPLCLTAEASPMPNPDVESNIKHTAKDAPVTNTNSESNVTQEFVADIKLLNYKQQRLFNDLEIERQFLKAEFSQPSTELWKRRARLYEEYVDLFCYINIKAIESKNPNLSKSCRYYLKQLNNYFPDHPLTVCALNGVASNECKQAYLEQPIGREGLHVNEIKTEFSNNLIKLKRSQLGTKIKELEKTVEKQQISFKQEETAERWIELKSSLSQKITYYCQDVDSAYIEFNPPDFTYGANLMEFQSYTSDKLYKTVYDLLHDPERLGNMYTRGDFKNKVDDEKIDYIYHPFETIDPNDIQQFRPDKYWRIRAISEKCYEAILEGVQFNPGLEAAACALHGKRSPYCIYAAKKLFKYLPDYIKKPKKERPTYEMESF